MTTPFDELCAKLRKNVFGMMLSEIKELTDREGLPTFENKELAADFFESELRSLSEDIKYKSRKELEQFMINIYQKAPLKATDDDLRFIILKHVATVLDFDIDKNRRQIFAELLDDLSPYDLECLRSELDKRVM